VFSWFQGVAHCDMKAPQKMWGGLIAFEKYCDHAPLTVWRDLFNRAALRPKRRD
jgi:hypothetical protein